MGRLKVASLRWIVSEHLASGPAWYAIRHPLLQKESKVKKHNLGGHQVGSENFGEATL